MSVADYYIEFYELDVTNAQFNKLDECRTFTDLSFSNVLNDIGYAQFSLNARDYFASKRFLKRYRNHVAIRRNGEVAWFGLIDRFPSFDIDATSGSVDVSCYDYLAHLKTRFLDSLTVFTNTNISNIAWELINEAQSRDNGELLIQQGTLTTIRNADRTYDAYANSIAELIANLSKVENGIDFQFTAEVNADDLVDHVEFSAYKTLGSNRQDKVLKLDDSLVSVRGASQSELYNSIYAIGAGTGDQLLVQTATNSTYQQAYTRRERILPNKDVSLLSTLLEKANYELFDQKVDKNNLVLTLHPEGQYNYDTFTLGDIVAYNVNVGGDLFVNQKGSAKVVEIFVTLTQDGTELTQLRVEALS